MHYPLRFHKLTHSQRVIPEDLPPHHLTALLYQRLEVTTESHPIFPLSQGSGLQQNGSFDVAS